METARCKAFLAAAQTGSFTRAAAQLNYTPSGVSQLVSALEKDFGFSLFLRGKKGVVLTENGAHLLPAVQEFLAQEDRLFSLATQINGLLTGSVAIAAYSSIATHWLPAVIRVFQRDYPQVQITMREGIRQEVVNWLDTRQVDLAFLSYMEPMPYQWVPLGEDPMLAVLPKEHPLADAPAYPLKNCAEDPFIMPALGRDDDVVALFESCGIVPNIKFTTLENFAALAMVEQGLGVSVMNELITRKRLCDVVKRPIDPPASILLGAAYPSQDSLSPAAKKFLEYSVTQLEKRTK